MRARLWTALCMTAAFWACDDDPVGPMDQSSETDQLVDQSPDLLPDLSELSDQEVSENNTPCDPNPCVEPNRSICRDLGTMILCDCDNGYQLVGESCVPIDTDPCEPNPCTEPNRSRCLWLEEGYDCACDVGYHEDQGLCCAENAHARGGTCVCDEGFVEVEGVCEADPNDPCSDAPCADAGIHRWTCVHDESEAGFRCECDENFEEQSGACLPTELGSCPAGTECEYGYCIRVDSPGEQCLHDGDCPGEMSYCNPQVGGGICLSCGGDSDCPTGTGCTSFNTCAISCSDDSDCPWGRCTGEWCVQRQCQVDADCPQSTICVDENSDGSGLCWRRPCEDNSCSPSNPNGTCSRIDERCIYGACVSSCNPNPCTQEPNKTVCAYETGAPICRCAEGYELDESGQCQSTSIQCPSGWTCDNGYCAKRDDPFFVCQVNSDCGTGRSCSPTLPSGTCSGCGDDEDCPLEHVCLADYCLRPCASDDDCHDGMRCRNGQYCGRMECTQPSDCPQPYVCNVGSDGNGTCQRPPC